jgi:ribokinase
VLNETELASLTGHVLTETADDAEIVAAARSLRGSRSSQVICVTLGVRGVIALAAEHVIIVPGRQVSAVDSTGAGDCFTGALAASLACGSDLRTALHFATDAAAISVQRHGAGPSMPSAADIAAFRADGTHANGSEREAAAPEGTSDHAA